MIEWLAGALLGFVGEFLRSLYDDHVARSALRENGRLADENARLKEQIRVKDQAQKIKERNDAENDLGAVIDGL